MCGKGQNKNMTFAADVCGYTLVQFLLEAYTDMVTVVQTVQAQPLSSLMSILQCILNRSGTADSPG